MGLIARRRRAVAWLGAPSAAVAVAALAVGMAILDRESARARAARVRPAPRPRLFPGGAGNAAVTIAAGYRVTSIVAPLP